MGDSVRIHLWDEITADTISNNLRDPADSGSHDGDAGRCGLEEGDPQTLHEGRVDQQVKAAQNPVQVLSETGKSNLLLDAQFAAHGFELPLKGALAE